MRRPCSCRPATGLVWSTSRSGTGCCPALLDQSEPCLAIPMAATTSSASVPELASDDLTDRPVFQLLDIFLDHLAVDQWEDFTNREKYLAVTLATCHSVLVKGGWRRRAARWR